MNTRRILLLVTALSCACLHSAHAQVDFESEVLPILETRCFECHSAGRYNPDTGRTSKPKGRFAMTSPALLMAGGSEGVTVVRGQPEKSRLYTYTTLPAAHEYAMPPEGKSVRLTKAQQETLRRWIAQGADFGQWKGRAPGKPGAARDVMAGVLGAGWREKIAAGQAQLYQWVEKSGVVLGELRFKGLPDAAHGVETRIFDGGKLVALGSGVWTLRGNALTIHVAHHFDLERRVWVTEDPVTMKFTIEDGELVMED